MPTAELERSTAPTNEDRAHDRAVGEWNRQVKAATEHLQATQPDLARHIQSTSDQDLVRQQEREHMCAPTATFSRALRQKGFARLDLVDQLFELKTAQ